MTYTANHPVDGDDIRTALSTYVNQNITHIVAAITQEHGWDNSNAALTTHDEGSARIHIATSAPTNKSPEGGLWLDTSAKKLYYDTGAAWVEVDLTGSYLALAGGTMSGEIAMGTNKITGLGAPSAGTDAATKSYADSIVGAGGTHAASHTDGTDDIQSSTDSLLGLMTAADHTKLTKHGTTIRRRVLTWGTTVDSGETAPSLAVAYGQRVLSFSASTDNTVYFDPVYIPESATGAYLCFMYHMSTANAGTVAICTEPYVDGVAVTVDSIVLTNGAADPNHNGDTAFHYLITASLTFGTLSSNKIIGCKFYRDVSEDTHTGEFVLVAAWLTFTGGSL